MLIYLDIKITHLKIAPLVGNLEAGNLEGILHGCKLWKLKLSLMCFGGVQAKSLLAVTKYNLIYIFPSVSSHFS